MMFRWRSKKRPALRREGWLTRKRRLGAARQPLKKIKEATAEVLPDFAGLTWPDVATISAAKEVVAAIRAWTYGRLGELRGEIHRRLARLDTAVRNQNAKLADYEAALSHCRTFDERVTEAGAETELHRKPSPWARGVFACCVAFATLALATPVQALGVGIDLGRDHQDLAQQIGNALAWVAAFVFGWITCALGKTIGTSFVNRAAQDLVKDARVASRYFWVVPLSGSIALIGSLYAAAIVRQGQLKLIGMHSPIPTWSFGLFTCAIEVAAIILGWATAHPVADAHRRLAAAKDAAHRAVVKAAKPVDRLLGEVLAVANEHDALALVANELQAAQFHSAAEEIAIRAAANPDTYGRRDPLDVASRAFYAAPVERLEINALLIQRAQRVREAFVDREAEAAPTEQGSDRPPTRDRPSGETARASSANGRHSSFIDK
jgi:hypothetical protein